MALKNRILPFVDQCPAHAKDVRSLSSLVLRLLQRLNSSEDSYKFSLLHAMTMLAMARNSVKKLLLTALGRLYSVHIQ
jgi:hypothetical protein